jgi:hypothetical protein
MKSGGVWKRKSPDDANVDNDDDADSEKDGRFVAKRSNADKLG